MRSIWTRAGALIDSGVVRLMERRMTAPRIHRDDARARLVEVAEAYEAVADRFFAAPETAVVTAERVGRGPLGTAVTDLQWASSYEPRVAAARAVYDATRENHTAHARMWTSELATDAARPAIVLIHGWGGGNPRVGELTMGVAYWLRHGFDVCAFVLPYHGARAPGASGALFPSGNPLRTNEAFGQAIHDLRALAAWLREARGATAVGALGMSLGGYTTALWASVDPELAFAVAMIPAVSFANLMWRHGESSPTRRRAVAAGIDEELLRRAFHVHEPLTRPAAIDRARLAVIAGRGDRITPPDHAEALAAHWGVPIRWFAGGHLAQLGRGDAIRDTRRQLGALALPGQVFRG